MSFNQKGPIRWEVCLESAISCLNLPNSSKCGVDAGGYDVSHDGGVFVRIKLFESDRIRVCGFCSAVPGTKIKDPTRFCDSGEKIESFRNPHWYHHRAGTL